MTTTLAAIASETKFDGFQFILAYTLPSSQVPNMRHAKTPDAAIEMIHKVLESYPDIVWYIVRRSDGVCIAQSKALNTSPEIQEQASTALVLPGCVTNLMLRSKSEPLPDGTVVFKFNGVVRSRLDLHAFYVIADARRWSKTSATFKGSGEGFDWKLVQYWTEAGGSNKVSFEMHDYSKKNENSLETRIARVVMLNKNATPAKIAKLIMTEIAR